MLVPAAKSFGSNTNTATVNSETRTMRIAFQKDRIAAILDSDLVVLSVASHKGERTLLSPWQEALLRADCGGEYLGNGGKARISQRTCEIPGGKREPV